jgi:hypothetical protein
MNLSGSGKNNNVTTSLFGLPSSGARVTGKPVSYKTFKDIVKHLKMIFENNQSTGTAAALSVTNAMGVILYLEGHEVPREYWGEVEAAIRDYCDLTDMSDIESYVQHFYRVQQSFHGGSLEDSASEPEAKDGKLKDATPNTRSKGKSDGAAEVEDARESKKGDKKTKKVATHMLLDVFTNGEGDIDTLKEKLEAFSDEAREVMDQVTRHLKISNPLVETALSRLVDDRTVMSIIEDVKALSKFEKAERAPKLFGIFGVDPTIYIVVQEIKRRLETNKLQAEPQIEAEKAYADLAAKAHEDFLSFMARFEEIRRQLAAARKLPVAQAVPVDQAIAKIITALEASLYPEMAKVGRELRKELAQRKRVNKDFQATLEEVKIAGESHYKSAILDLRGTQAPASESKRGTKQNTKRGRGVKLAVSDVDADPTNAVANMAHGRKVCKRCYREGHEAEFCRAPYPVKNPAASKAHSRSPSRQHAHRKKAGGEGVGSSPKQHTANAAATRDSDVELLKYKYECERLKNELAAARRPSAAADEDPSPGVFA